MKSNLRMETLGKYVTSIVRMLGETAPLDDVWNPQNVTHANTNTVVNYVSVGSGDNLLLIMVRFERDYKVIDLDITYGDPLEKKHNTYYNQVNVTNMDMYELEAYFTGLQSSSFTRSLNDHAEEAFGDNITITSVTDLLKALHEMFVMVFNGIIGYIERGLADQSFIRVMTGIEMFPQPVTMPICEGVEVEIRGARFKTPFNFVVVATGSYLDVNISIEPNNNLLRTVKNDTLIGQYT